MSDFISRQDAINEANAWLLDCFKVQKQDRSCGLIRRLENLPPAQLANEWIPFEKRPLTEEEEEIYPEWSWMLDCPTPEDEEDILVSDGKYVWVDTWWNCDGFCRLDSDRELEGLAWMRFPDPWKGGTE